MKRWKKILLGVLAALVLIIGGLCVCQWNNIQALYTFLTMDSEQIAQNLEEKRAEHHQAIQAATGAVTVTPPSTADTDAVLNGTATPEEVKQALGITEQLKLTEEPAGPGAPPAGQHPTAGGSEAAEGTGSSAGESGASANEQPVQDYTDQDLINSCVAELYGCKIDIMAVLGDLKQEAVAEWNALPAEERTSTKKKEIGFAGLDACYELESDVDDQVREILGRYRDRMSARGGDLAIFDQLWDYYQDEKAAEKSYYLDKYMN